MDKNALIAEVAKITGVSPDICTKVLSALEQVMKQRAGEEGVSGLLGQAGNLLGGLFGKK